MSLQQANTRERLCIFVNKRSIRVSKVFVNLEELPKPVAVAKSLNVMIMANSSKQAAQHFVTLNHSSIFSYFQSCNISNV